MILGGNAQNHMLVYSDIENFKHFNQKLGYSEGDKLLKEFCQFVSKYPLQAMYTNIITV